MENCKQRKSLPYVPPITPPTFERAPATSTSGYPSVIGNRFPNSSLLDEAMHFNTFKAMKDFEGIFEDYNFTPAQRDDFMSTDFFNASNFEKLSAWTSPRHDTFYEPPKPDTPPSKVPPMYYDPVWMSYPSTTMDSQFEEQSFNIHLPKLKTVNTLSPYTEEAETMPGPSINRRQSFDFPTDSNNNDISK